jgi:HK97 family phage major capsid protein
MTEIETLRNQRTAKLAEARAIHAQGETEKRTLTPEEQTAFDGLVAQVDEHEQRISDLEAMGAPVDPNAVQANSADAGTARSEKLANLEASSKRPAARRSSPIEAPAFVRDFGDRQSTSDRALALRGWLGFHSVNGASDAQRVAAQRSGLELGNNRLNFKFNAKAPRSVSEARAQSVGTTTAGGFTVPQGFLNQLEASLLAFGGMREVATVLRTAEGNDLPIPTVSDHANVGAILAENTQVAEQDITFGQITLKAYKYSSKLIRVSAELLQDSAIDLESFIGGALGERIARILNTHFTTGDNSSKPQGITASGAGVTAASATAITYGELVELQHSVDPSYRANARFMMHDSTFKAIRKLLDGQNRPIFQPDITAASPGTLLGSPIVINQDCATIAASAKAVFFGDFSKYIIRDVQDFTLLRLEERYADYHQVGFVGFSRHDGRILDAGTDPIKHLVLAAS